MTINTRKLGKSLQELIDINPKYSNGLTFRKFATAEAPKEFWELIKINFLEVAKAKKRDDFI